MTSKSYVWLPCAVFFSAGLMTFGVLTLLMQCSLVFWPLASRMARLVGEKSGVERMLAELSETHRVKVDPYARPSKRFRQVA